MKKITLLLLMILPLLGFGQTTIENYTFDPSSTDGWVSGNSATVAYDGTNYYTAAGSLNLTTTATNKVAKVNFSITETGDYTVKFKIKGPDGNVKGIINQGSNDAGTAILMSTLPSSSGGDGTTWYEYSYTWTLTSLTAPQLQIQGAAIGTYYIDDVTVVKEACVGYAITVETDGGGTNEITTVLPCYPEASSVEFTATPSCGDFAFDQWEIDGTLSGITANPHTYTVGTADATIKALFTATSTPPDTNFDTDVELSNWIATSNSTATASGDNLTWTISGTSPKIKYDACSFAPETWNITHLKIGYSNETANTRLRLVHPKDGGLTYINFDGLATGDAVTPGVGVIDEPLTHGTWIDFLSSIEFFIKLNSENGNAVNGDFVIDYIEFYTPASIAIASTAIGSWSIGATWIGGVVPTGGDDVTIDHAVTINGDEVANNVTVSNTGVLAFNNGKSLKLTGDLVNNGTESSVVLRNNSTQYSSLIVDGTVTGDIRHRRFINANPANDLISPAVNITSFSDFYTDNGSRFYTYADSGIAFGPFDPTTNTYLQYAPTTTTALTPGKGYVIGAVAGTASAQTFNFHGTVETGTVNAPIAVGGGSAWHLIGNPYPSYIEALNFLNFEVAAVKNIDLLADETKAIYGYNATAGLWTIYNYVTLDASTLIAPGQGFYVAANANGNIVFDPSIRTKASGTPEIDDDFISLRTTLINKALAKIQLTNASNTFATDIYFADSQTRGLDPGYDAGAFQGNADGIFTHLVEDNTGVEMAIQALDYNDFNDVVVPLGVKSDSGVQLSISLDATTATIPSNINVYLEDNVANTWTLLNTGDYTFTPSVELNGTGRFFVHFSSTTLSLEDNEWNGLQIYTSLSTKELLIKGQLTGIATANLYDIQGRLVLSKDLDLNSNSNSIDISILSTGIYVVKVDNGNQIKTQKIIIK